MIAIEESRVVDGPVMMDLAPAMIEKAEDAGRAKGKIEGDGRGFEAAAFATNGVEDFSGNVKRVVEELDGNAGGTGEKFFVDATDFGPAAFGAAKGVIEGDIVSRRPILPHEDDISSVKCTIELSQSVTGMGKITKIFEAGDGIEQGGKSG